MALGALTVATALGALVGLPAKPGEVAARVVAEQHHVPPAAAVATVGPTAGHVSLAAERDAAVSAVATLDPDLRSILKHVQRIARSLKRSRASVDIARVKRGFALARLGMLVALAIAGAAVILEPPAIAAVVVLSSGMYLALYVWMQSVGRRAAIQNEQSLHAALHDPVTDLPNRVLMHDRIASAIEHAERRGNRAAVLLLDLDRFKDVNDTLGHHSGDLLLHTVGQRLRASVRSSDSVARLGGDEFALLLTDLGDVAAAEEVARSVHLAVSEPVELEGIGIEVEPSIGIAVFPDHGTDPETLLQHADVAMYTAKRAHGEVAVYDLKIDSGSRERLELVAELRRAIDEDELTLHFQPKGRLPDGEVLGVEALVRWDHPDRGRLAPDRFIPLAERTGLMAPLTHHVLDRALAQNRRWADLGLELGIAVNISTRNLHDLTLPDQIQQLLELHGVPAKRLELEVTETTIMADPPRAKAVLARLSALGVGLAVDDFGTGYTSLAWLRDLPLTTLKIDRSFVGSMCTNRGDSIIVRSTVQLGRNLGLEVVAEGVEDALCWDQLADLGCEVGQGFYLCRPQPADALTAWMLGGLEAPPDDRLAGGAHGLENRSDLGVVG